MASFINKKPFDKEGIIYKESLDLLKMWSERYLFLNDTTLCWSKDEIEREASKIIPLKRIKVVTDGEHAEKVPKGMPKGQSFGVLVQGFKPVMHYFYCETDYEKSLWVQQISHNVALVNGAYDSVEEKLAKQLDILQRINTYKLKLAKKEGDVLYFSEGMLTSWHESYIVLEEKTFTVYKGGKGGKVLFTIDRLAGCTANANAMVPKGMEAGHCFEILTKFGDSLIFYCPEIGDKNFWVSMFGNNVMFDESGYFDRPPPPVATLGIDECKEKLSSKGLKEIKALASPHKIDWTGCLSKEDIIEKAVQNENFRKDLSALE